MNKETDNIIKTVALTIFGIIALSLVVYLSYESGRMNGWNAGYSAAWESTKTLLK